jgi:hypothetical protein
MRTAILLSAFALSASAAAQTPASNPNDKLRPPVRLSRAEEIAFARNAAPELVAAKAAVWVLGDKGYEKASEGTNGYGCIVQRGTNGQSLIPRCDDAGGVAALFPVFALLEEMRAQGRTVAEYRAAVAEGYRTGKFKAPPQGGFSYMYSIDAFFVTDSGTKVDFTPHVMVFWPYCDARALGVEKPEQLRETHMSLLDIGSPECHLIVNTPANTARTARLGATRTSSETVRQ